MEVGDVSSGWRNHIKEFVLDGLPVKQMLPKSGFADVAENRAILLSDMAKQLVKLCAGLREVIATANGDTVARIYNDLDKIEKATGELRKAVQEQLSHRGQEKFNV